jgi:hypothetical protein
LLNATLLLELLTATVLQDGVPGVLLVLNFMLEVELSNHSCPFMVFTGPLEFALAKFSKADTKF